MKPIVAHAIMLGILLVGSVSAEAAVLTCSPDHPPTSIHAVQGAGAASPLAGATVMIEGVVVGDFQGGGLGADGDLRGFYLQEQDAEIDADPATSEGIFVFDGGAPGVDVSVGDLVCVVGEVVEYFGETQLDATVVGATVAVGAGGLTLPTARVVMLPVAGTTVSGAGGLIADLEAYEGERIRIPGKLTVTSTAQLDAFGQLTLAAGGRLRAFTQTNAPDAAGFAAWNEDAARRTLLLDDGFSAPDPDPIPYPPPALGLTNRVRAGDRVGSLVGVVRYSRGAGTAGAETYRLMPTRTPAFFADNPRPPAPAPVGGAVRVAALNLERYYNGNGGVPSGFPSPGADTFSEYVRQTDKLVAALAGLDADIVGLIELENDYADGLESAIDDLTEALNAAVGGGTYAYLDPGVNLGDGPIAVGLLYKPARVTPVGPLLAHSDPAFTNPFGYVFPLNRPALTQTFETSTGAFTVSVNHFKAKGCGPPPVGLDQDQGDGQTCFNETRTVGAQALLDWLAGDPTGTAALFGAVDPDVLILGDLNAQPMEDPIAALIAGPDDVAGTADDYVDLLTTDDYSFVFQGAQSRLDYAVASPSLAPQITGAAVWSINADEPDAFDFNENLPAPAALYAVDPYRSSDHDPVVVGVDPMPLATVIEAFGAEGNAVGVRLDWRTTVEVFNAGFEVQRQENGAWEALGFVEGAGTTEKPQKYRWFSKRLAPGPHTFRLKQIDPDGRFRYSDEVTAEVGGGPGDVAVLTAAHPNPFNPRTTLTVTVGQAQTVRVAAYDLLGREVAVLFDGRLAPDAAQPITFDAAHLPTGTYMVRAMGEAFIETVRVVLAK